MNVCPDATTRDGLVELVRELKRQYEVAADYENPSHTRANEADARLKYKKSRPPRRMTRPYMETSLSKSCYEILKQSGSRLRGLKLASADSSPWVERLWHVPRLSPLATLMRRNISNEKQWLQMPAGPPAPCALQENSVPSQQPSVSTSPVNGIELRTRGTATHP